MQNTKPNKKCLSGEAASNRKYGAWKQAKLRFGKEQIVLEIQADSYIEYLRIQLNDKEVE